MVAELIEFKVCPVTGNILLDATTGYFEDNIRNKDVTAQVVGALIQKIGVGNKIKVGAGKCLWTILVTDESTTSGNPSRKMTTTEKVAKTKASSTAWLKLLDVSPELEQVVGSGPMHRSEVISQIWMYIKAKGLQHRMNKKMINCDIRLKEIFNKDFISMFDIPGGLSKHLSEPK